MILEGAKLLESLSVVLKMQIYFYLVMPVSPSSRYLNNMTKQSMMPYVKDLKMAELSVLSLKGEKRESLCRSIRDAGRLIKP